jgi:hypothetical protein
MSWQRIIAASLEGTRVLADEWGVSCKGMISLAVDDFRRISRPGRYRARSRNNGLKDGTMWTDSPL